MIYRDFKGVWIPKEIYLDKRLTALDKIIFIEINSLDNGDEKGCFASNEYLAYFCQCSISKVTKSINKLKELGYIRVIGSDGRKRFLRSYLIKSNSLTNTKYEAQSEKVITNNIDNTIECTEVEEGLLPKATKEEISSTVKETTNLPARPQTTIRASNASPTQPPKELKELTVEELERLKQIVLENRDSKLLTYREIQKMFDLVDKVTYDTPTECNELIKQRKKKGSIRLNKPQERCTELGTEVF